MLDVEAAEEISGIDAAAPVGLKLGGGLPGGDPGGEPGLSIVDLEIDFVGPGTAGGELAADVELAGDGSAVLPDDGAVGVAGEDHVIDSGGAVLVVGDDDGGVIYFEAGEEGDVVVAGGFGLLGIIAAAETGEELGDLLEIPIAIRALGDIEARLVDGDFLD